MLAKSELRQLEHNKIRRLLAENLLPEAVQSAKLAILNYGSHVGILSDLIACQYEMGLFQDCTDTTLTLKSEFQNNISLLSADSAFRTALFLSKICEEQGALSDSLHFFMQAKRFAQNLRDQQIISIQELRFYSYFGIKENLSKRYLSLLNLQMTDSFAEIEFQHGLLWAEWSLFGVLHAQERMKVIRKLRMTSVDQRLVHRDFLEILLISKLPRSEMKNTLDELKKLQPNSYDLFLIELAENQRTEQDYLYSLDLSLMQKLRILILDLNYTQNSSRKAELRKKYQFVTGGLDQSSQRILNQLLPKEPFDDLIDITLLMDSSQVLSKNWKIKLSNLQCQLLECLKSQTLWSLDNLVFQLWQEKWSDSHYHRIRMMVYKLNKGINQETGYDLVHISKHEIKLNSLFRIH